MSSTRRNAPRPAALPALFLVATMLPLATLPDAGDGQIDRLVYELYGLSDEEIRIVEEASANKEES